MARKIEPTSELFGIEIETTRGTRERVWPGNGSELEASRAIVEGWLTAYSDELAWGSALEGRAATSIRALHLVRVTYMALGDAGDVRFREHAETLDSRYRMQLQAEARRARVAQTEQRAA